VRARSPNNMQGHGSPRVSAAMIKQISSGHEKRMRSNERNAAMKVSININTNTVKNSLGMKKTVKNFSKMKALTNRNCHRSFNLGNNLDRLKDGSPYRSDDVEQKGTYSTNESDVRLSELLQFDMDENTRNLDAKIEDLMIEKLELLHKIDKIDDENKNFQIENDKLVIKNVELQDRITKYIDSSCESASGSTLVVLKQELISKSNELVITKEEYKSSLDSLKKCLREEKKKCSEITLKIEQQELKQKHSETKIKNLERSLMQKTKENEKLKIEQKIGSSEEIDSELMKFTKEMSLSSLKLQRSEDQQQKLKKDLEEKNKIIQDQDEIIKALKHQLQESNEIQEEKLRKKQSEIALLQRDIEFTNKKHEDEIRKNNRIVKNKDIEIERLQDKVQMLEIKMERSTPEGSPAKESNDEKKQSNFNYAAHWVIEENLRERISELKKELTDKKETIETLTAERDNMETQLIKVKTQWANSELQNAQIRMSPEKDESESDG
jgi:hypothetical protein